MKKELVFAGIMTIAFLLAMTFVAANFTYGSNNIENDYVGGGTIIGTINLSFSSQPINSILSTNFGNSIKLIDLLRNNSLVEGTDYSCSFAGCTDSYNVSMGPVSSATLQDSGVQAVGFKLTGNDVQINSVKLSLSSNIAPSCSSELQVGLLANATGAGYMQSNKYRNETCSNVIRGCYNRTLNSNDWPGITTDRYCEKMTLPVAPAFQVGARIMNRTAGTNDDNLVMEIYDSNWNSEGACTLPKNSQQIQDVSCTIVYPNSGSSTNYVCISAENGGADYKINSEDVGPVCGNEGTNFNNYVIDYDIFAQPMKFDSISFDLNESTYADLTGDSLSGLADDYIEQKYNRNCTSAQGCIIPFELLSNSQQTLTFSKVDINYNKLGASSIDSYNLYILNKSEPTITSKFINLDISKAGFTLPVSSSQKNLRFYLDNSSIFPAISISITSGFTFDVNPKTVLVGVDTSFYTITSANISSIVWDFGDGSTVTTQSKTASHRYSTEGIYTVNVEVTNVNDVTVKKSFSIVVGDIQTAVNTLITQDGYRISNLSAQINSYDPWIRDILNKKLNLTNANQSLQEIKDMVANGGNYSDALNELIALNLPKKIVTSGKGSLPLDVGFNNIDSSYVIALAGDSGQNVLANNELKQNVINWNTDHYTSTAQYQTISAQADSGETPLFTDYSITFAPKDAMQTNSNIIINYPLDQITFKDNYGQRELSSESSSATVIPLQGSKQIEFILPEKVEVSELGAYIAPPLSEIMQNESITPGKTNPRPVIGSWLYVILAIALLIVYVILQEWYKKRYESFLFKNKDDLYNIVNFIFNSRASGMKDVEILKKLEEYHWKNEQVSYAFKKIDGKRTGMWEIPLFKFIENRRVRKEIALRQGQNMGKERFIKRPY